MPMRAPLIKEPPRTFLDQSAQRLNVCILFLPFSTTFNRNYPHHCPHYPRPRTMFNAPPFPPAVLDRIFALLATLFLPSTAGNLEAARSAAAALLASYDAR